MTLTTSPLVDPSGAGPRSWSALKRGTVVVWLAAGLAVLARLPFVGLPAGADEAGFLQVARQWSAGGGSLYGHYWVDRPPLLITLHQLAGGLTALRLLGCAAAAVTVLLSAATADRLAGRRAAAWTAVVAAALLASPLVGSDEVNGELLSAPFVAAGLLALVAATGSADRRRAVVLAAAGGAAGVGALMVKQNIIDVLVFGAVYLGLTGWAHRSPAGRTRDLGAGAVAGAVGAVVVVSGWTIAHGTSMPGVFDAMYPFRLEAARAVAAGGSSPASVRGVHLALAWITSGLAVLTAAVVLATARHRRRDPALLALAATVVYDSVSIGFGGGYWLHYLVELAVPLAVWTGVLAGRGHRLPRLAALLVVPLTVVGLVTSSFGVSSTDAATVGRAVGRVAHPGDTLTTLYGEAEVNFTSGLPSPYQYLWSLPVKVRDPQLSDLDAVLAGPDAPTWLVVVHSVASWGLGAARAQSLITTDYHPVAVIDGQTVYLHDGLTRAPPVADGTAPS